MKYKPGALISKGYRNGKLVLTDKVVTAGEPYSVRVSGYKYYLKADGEDALTLKFEILDNSKKIKIYLEFSFKFNIFRFSLNFKVL